MTDQPSQPMPGPAPSLPAFDPGNPLIFTYLNRAVAVTCEAVVPPVPELGGRPLLALTFRDVSMTYTHWLDETLAKLRISQLEQGIEELKRNASGLIVPGAGFHLPPEPGRVNGHRRP